ncbi:hypothetical protein LD731_05245 [Lactobacillus delbrueckii subsp. delbrueckii]|uniref:YitT family protein n=1 Tax=Lactobacillus delbrueckii TaxID=1584 RepID=UPI00090B8FF4|nr:YitT family protein [Lactobacillus delbrueckii]APG71512.1 hypothetical protein LD731_05245 [Lactobacillus delbrueckii subsp. delbrueckii]BBL27726.1 membrane protein [Lactobacillus delbrueckii subsp. delbrueckii]GEA74994.1 membrane protein [Lactobacillus delbrueckii subsp. delbrueckii]
MKLFDLNRFSRNYGFLVKIGTAILYSVMVAVALNFFWHPGHIYSSGITGFAQIVNTVTSRYMPFTIPTEVMYFALNVPLFILAWFKIGREFTAYTIFAVAMSTIMMRFIQPTQVSLDPILCAIFGAAVNGIGTGMALKSGISTGGLDILGIVVRKKTGMNYGNFNILINLIIVLIAGFLFDWSRALYTALNIFINGHFIDSVYTQHNKLQVMIVTEHPNAIIEGIQEKMHRGITIFHDVEGAYGHTEKTVLLTIIDTYDLYDIQTTVEKCDPFVFMSVTEVQKVYGRFREQKVV